MTPNTIVKIGESTITNGFLQILIPIVGANKNVPTISAIDNQNEIMKKWQIEKTKKAKEPMAETQPI